MKKLFAVLAIAALSSVVARAEDKGTEFKFGGEAKETFYYDNNPTFASSGGINDQYWQMKNQFHINAISSDKLQAYFNLLHYTIWGGAQGVPTSAGPMGTTGTATTVPFPAPSATIPNALQVNEAWMWWKASDMLSLRVGRQGIDYGDGLVFSKNDWLMTPYTADALMARFGWDFLDLDLGGGVLTNQGTPTAAGGVAAGNTTPLQTDFYGFYGSFKNLPDFLKKAEIFALQINSDNTGAAAGSFAPFAPSFSGTTSWNLTSYGIHVKGDVSQLDYRVDAVLQSGKQKNGVIAGQDINFSGNMVDAEVGYGFPEFMKGRVFVNYHMDSGQDLTAVSGTTSFTNAQYQPLFYDQHDTAGGKMDIFGWGNFTDIRVGLNLQPMEDTWLGLEVNLASRTQKNGAYTGGQGANFGNNYVLPVPVSTTSAALQAAQGTSLGTEVDLWAKHTYGHGFSTLGQIGYVSLGNYYTAPGGTAPGSAYQFLAQAKYAF